MKIHDQTMKCSMILLALVGAAGVAIAANGTTAQGGIKDAQQRSAAVKRDPFWPVGYVPRNVQTIAQAIITTGTPAADNSWDEAMKRVVINGVSSRADNEYFAVINGEVKSVGDTVSVVLGSSVYTWAVGSIQPPGSVKLRRISVR